MGRYPAWLDPGLASIEQLGLYLLCLAGFPIGPGSKLQFGIILSDLAGIYLPHSGGSLETRPRVPLQNFLALRSGPSERLGPAIIRPWGMNIRASSQSLLGGS